MDAHQWADTSIPFRWIDIVIIIIAAIVILIVIIPDIMISNKLILISKSWQVHGRKFKLDSGHDVRKRWLIKALFEEKAGLDFDFTLQLADRASASHCDSD